MTSDKNSAAIRLNYEKLSLKNRNYPENETKYSADNIHKKKRRKIRFNLIWKDRTQELFK